MQVSRTTETLVGLFVALGLAALFFVAMQVSNLASLTTAKGSYTVTARFANIGGLKVRAPVSMAGVKVGRVHHIRFDHKTFEAIVEMRIEPEYNTLPVDTSASILTAGLLGEQYVGLTPGGMDETLKDGDQLELTQSAIVLEQMISRFLFNKAESGTSDKAGAVPAQPAPDDKPGDAQ